jgi:hypothetical protein
MTQSFYQSYQCRDNFTLTLPLDLVLAAEADGHLQEFRSSSGQEKGLFGWSLNHFMRMNKNIMAIGFILPGRMKPNRSVG